MQCTVRCDTSLNGFDALREPKPAVWLRILCTVYDIYDVYTVYKLKCCNYVIYMLHALLMARTICVRSGVCSDLCEFYDI